MSSCARFDLTGRTALVTGSSRGIGAALALALAEAGADVAIHYTGQRPAAEAVAAAVQALGRRSAVLGADLGDPAAPRQLYAAVIAAFGHLDILVSNASVQYPEALAEVSREHFDTQVTVNWRSAFELIQLALPAMQARGWGRILTVGSVQEARPHPEMVVYAATKAAQTCMVHNLAKQVAAQGVTVNNLAPGVIDTDRNRDRLNRPGMRDTVLGRIPAGRIGSPDDCVGAALLLCSDAGRYITGQNLFVDGGMSL